MKDTLEILKALSEQNRLRIAMALRVKKMCVCELHEMLDISNSTLSSHLKTLRYAGIIDQEKDGRWIDYFLDAKNPKIISILDFVYEAMNDRSVLEADKKKVQTLSKDTCNSYSESK